ncbi:molybdopterin synthase catalytic subunit MoaE [Zhongshania sp.]|uniref:molybdopterin synthase catalytic subunit MoaE n=1 Tax=Zhongshania sp. TaxID=1971902 RepID=UPI001B62CC99|nr:molybdopterin synthase catalytic subunit MoaE [Zhongshania sp.]MBQ0796348.1 molybdopterin synthase catalytic subunit MoaE [Zhongshania sp.]
MQSRVLIHEADFDVSEECRALVSSNRCGAVAQFVGVMRDYNEGDDVVAMELEHYPGMTERSIESIIERANTRWPLLSVTVIHRVGKLLPGAQIVFVGVGAMHRHAAFAACEFIMDYLKTEAPFWKKEKKSDGSERWVDARVSDAESLARWAE